MSIKSAEKLNKNTESGGSVRNLPCTFLRTLPGSIVFWAFLRTEPEANGT